MVHSSQQSSCAALVAVVALLLVGGAEAADGMVRARGHSILLTPHGHIRSLTVPQLAVVLTQLPTKDRQEAMCEALPLPQLRLLITYLKQTEEAGLPVIDSDSLKDQGEEVDQDSSHHKNDGVSAEELAGLLAETSSKEERTAMLSSLTAEQRASVKAYLAGKAKAASPRQEAVDGPVALVQTLASKFVTLLAHLKEFLREHGIPV